MTDDLEQLSGVGEKTATKLKRAGYNNIENLAKTSPGTLEDRTEVGYNKAEKLVEKARDNLDAVGDFMSGREVEEEQEDGMNITTGSDALDDVFMGGIPTGHITEAYGEFSTSKTQLAHQLSVNTIMPEENGGLGKEVIYIDTEDTFSARRFREMAEHADLDPDEAMKQIKVGQAVDAGHQMELAREKAQKLCSSRDVGLVVVDSIIARFRSEYDGRGELADRQKRLGSHLRDLRSLANQHNVAVYITNQVHDDPGQRFGNPTKPVGGHVLGHASAFRLWLRSKKDSFVGRLVDSPYLPETEAEFTVTEKGIEDV